MYKVKDRIMLGIMTGLLSATPSRLMNAWEYKRGFTDRRYGEVAASLFLPNQKNNDPQARLVGSLVNHVNTAITGVLVTYLLSATGRDKAMVKGAGVTATAWLAIYGLTARMGVGKQSKNPTTHLLSFKDHILFGMLCGLTASRFGSSALFPESRKTAQKKQIPLIATNAEPPGTIKSRLPLTEEPSTSEYLH